MSEEEDFVPDPAEPPRSRLGWALVLGVLVVAVLAAILGGVVLDNALGGRLRDRTIWGVLLMAVGAAGPVVASVVLVRRRVIVGQVAKGQWSAVALFPGSFVAAWVAAVAGYGVAGKEATTPIIPHTPEFVVTIGPGSQAGFNALGDFAGSNESRAGGGPADDVSFRYQVRTRSNESPITFEGVISRWGADRGAVEVRGTLVVTQWVRLRVEGAPDAVLLIDDRPVTLPAELEPGTYSVVIRGTPRE